MKLQLCIKLFVTAVFFCGMPLPAQNSCNYEAMQNENINLLDGYKFIRSFQVETTKQNEKAGYSYLLNHDTKYRLVIVDNGNKGERMMVSIRDRDKKIISTNKDKQNRSFLKVLDFVCPSTGIYFFEIKFEDDRRDCGLNILGFQK